MTFGIHNIVGIHRLHTGQKNYSTPLIFRTYKQWSYWERKAFDYLIWCHLDRAVEFSVALLCWFWIFPLTFSEANEWHFQWVFRVFLFNIACEFTTYPFWHWMTHARRSPYAQGPLHEKKFNPVNPYEDKGQDHLLREITFTTLGWLQSSFVQCIFMWLWASGRLPYYGDFWSRPFFSIFILLNVTYWSAFHFYWSHRFMHPWWSVRNGVREGDIGAFLYRHFHSLHHRSHNPGPWSGLSMHPVEHFFYYTRAYFPLLFSCHPLHFLFAKFQADIGPISGHDGHDNPAGGAAFHYLHHAFFECNYGTPLIDFDRLFGTYKQFVKKPINK
ncbi:unnamed protein product [Rotaria sordida]|uniref:Fatty acid hydroxylase domain-containing protein n=1 Tax=Rotaria sordida TaxID=392033 RepID=A0A818MB97_9BILA|nr:unnamed protein product [Rotaria sordida]CAF3588267.1 unnamed protein product [Rotaria sordida]